MSEDTSTTSASETASATEGSGSAGSVADGSDSGSQGGGASSTASDSGLEARVRAEQGRADRAAAELAKVQARLAELEAGSSSDSGAGSPPAVGITQADLVRMEEMRDYRDALRAEFPLASADLTRNYLQYDSPESMRLAVARSHEAEKADQERRDAEAEARVRKQYEERLGKLPPETPTDAGAGEGLPTIAQINSWPLNKQMEFEAKNPGVIQRLTDEAMASVPILQANK